MTTTLIATKRNIKNKHQKQTTELPRCATSPLMLNYSNFNCIFNVGWMTFCNSLPVLINSFVGDGGCKSKKDVAPVTFRRLCTVDCGDNGFVKSTDARRSFNVRGGDG